MRGQFAHESGHEIFLGKRHRGLGDGTGRRDGLQPGDQRQRAGESEDENGAEGAHGHQRFILATFWSISSEVWMDFELIS